MNIPVTFTFQNKEYKGILSEVSGAGAERGSFWHLYIDNYYWGQLLYLERGFVFYAQNNTKEMEYLGEVFERFVVAYYQ